VTTGTYGLLDGGFSSGAWDGSTGLGGLAHGVLADKILDRMTECGAVASQANGQSIAAGDVQIAANFLMKSRRFKLASEGFPTGGAGNQRNNSPRARPLEVEAIVLLLFGGA
jgi:hypothetical protein